MAANLNKDCSCWAEWTRCYKDSSPSLNTLRRAFTALVRWAFSDPSKMADYGDALGCYKYTPGAQNNILSINPGSTIDPGDTENIPGIIISIGDGVSFEKVGMQPYLSESPDTASSELVNLATANLTILCRDKDADVCCMMADLCTMFLFALTERLFDTWSWLRQYELKAQTEPKIKQAEGSQDDTKWYESTVTFSLAYEYRVFVARESKRLKDFSLGADMHSGLVSIR